MKKRYTVRGLATLTSFSLRDLRESVLLGAFSSRLQKYCSKLGTSLEDAVAGAKRVRYIT